MRDCWTAVELCASFKLPAGEVKFTLEQATKAHRGSTLSLT
jgi:hypothetical protein